MPLTREQINAHFNEVMGMATPETQARMSELLTALRDEYDHTLTESENAATEMQRLTRDNETLRSVNTKLFLQVGTPAPKVDDPDGGKTDPPPSETLTYEKLFNEKGELI